MAVQKPKEARLPKEKILEELIKCKKSPHYFISKYCKIQHTEKGMIPFALWDFQKEILNDYITKRYVLTVKSRQIGISTLTACYALWFILFHDLKSVLLVATQKTAAQILKEKIVFAYDNLPNWLRVEGVENENLTYFKLNNGSWIKCAAPTERAVRGESISLLVFDEAAFIEHMDVLWTAARPTVAHGGKVVVLSSPGGEGNWFHTEVEKSRRGDGIFLLREVMWYHVPTRDAAWEAEERRSMTVAQFAQEYECSFLASGSTVVDLEVLRGLADEAEEPRYVGGIDQGLHVWEDYVPGGTYFMTLDVSRGDSTDYSVANVFRVRGSKFEQACEYQGKIPLDQFASFVFELGNQYGQCLIVGESNNIGNHVLLVLKAKGYPRLYYGKREWDPEEFYDPYMNYDLEPGRSLGIYTTSANRPVFVVRMQEAVRTKKVLIRSARLVGELRTFVWKDGKPQASGSNNDDLVMSLCFASWIFLSVFRDGTDNDENNYLDLNSLIEQVSKKRMQSIDEFFVSKQKDNRIQTVEDYRRFEWIMRD